MKKISAIRTRKVLIKRIAYLALTYLIFVFLIPNLHAESKSYIEVLGGAVVGGFDQGYDANGTSTSSGTTIATTNGTTNGTNSGLGLGLRYGTFLGEHFFVAADGRYDITSMEQMLIYTGNKKYKAGRLALGGILGVKFDQRAIWFGYAPLDRLTITDDQTKAKNTYTGNSLKLGFGYRWTRFGINLEFSQSKYNTRDNVDLPATYIDDGITIREKKLQVYNVLLSISIYQFL